MLRKFLVLSLVLCMFLVFGGSAAAGEEKPFDSGELNKFITDIQDIPGLTAAGQKDMDSMQKQGMPDMESMQFSSAKMQSSIESKGWDTDRFYYVYGHVLGVVALENVDRMTKEVAPQLAEAMRQIQNNPHMSEAQKKEILTQMGEGMSEGNQDLKKVREDINREVPQSEQSLVKSRYEDICEALGMPATPNMNAGNY
jgi:hypothetical protein